MIRIYYTGDSLRVSPRQCSRIYNDLREACAILDVRNPTATFRRRRSRRRSPLDWSGTRLC